VSATVQKSIQLPKGWVLTTLETVTSRISNGTTEKQNKEKKGVPVTRIETISNEKIDLKRVGYINAPTPQILEKYQLFKGDILFSHINSDSHLGKTALFNLEGHTLLHGMNLLLIRPFKGLVNPAFLNFLFQYYRFSGTFVSIAQHAVNQSSINQTKIKSIKVPIAPYAEQSRIVDKVERLFSFLDAGVASLRKVQAQLKRYRKAVLKYAFEGKLTEEWRRTHKEQIEPAGNLLERIKQERIRRGIGAWKSKERINIGELPQIPNDWTWVHAQEVCENITNGYTPKASELHNPDAEIPFVKINNLTFTGELDFSKNPTFISRKIHESTLKRSRVLPGDVLINIVGPPLGKVSIIPDTYPEWNINQAIVFFRPIEGYNRDFLALCLQTDIIMSHLSNQAKATAGQFNISVNMSRNLPIPLPPWEEQERIVSEVKKHFAAIQDVNAILTHSMEHASSLRNSILMAAFKGQLVPQNPADEPAKKLLERIRAERISDKKTKSYSQLGLSHYVK
jgi:type I restriction enzyme S subunit